MRLVCSMLGFLPVHRVIIYEQEYKGMQRNTQEYKGTQAVRRNDQGIQWNIKNTKEYKGR